MKEAGKGMGAAFAFSFLETPPAQLVPISFDQEVGTICTIRALSLGVVDVACVDVVDPRSAGLGLGL